MQSNKTFNLEKQSYTPRKQQQHPQQHLQQKPPEPIPANEQQVSSHNDGLTIDLKNFRKPREKTLPDEAVSLWAISP
ncbi:hypothetical protein U0070_023551 [Myodes glareolus]|uniref:Uncharacterized protein n=1 Tax=Myodes glareolus TaxID=447135 RepID=A0AAW0I0Y6_MYOGA